MNKSWKKLLCFAWSAILSTLLIPTSYSLTPSNHSHSQTIALAFIRLHCSSPQGRPAQQSATSGSHYCLSHLPTWRLSCHPTHTHTHTHTERKRERRASKDSKRTSALIITIGSTHKDSVTRFQTSADYKHPTNTRQT